MSWKLAKLPVLLLILGIAATSCQNGADLFEPSNQGQPDISGITANFIPPGAVLESATFCVYLTAAQNETVNVHRITAPWDEFTVTWNSFGGSYDPAVEASFVADALGWKCVDVTSLVQGWLDGDYENYGLVLEQGTTPFTQFLGSEHGSIAERPKLEVCYQTDSGVECVTIQRGTLGEVADAYIRWLTPDINYGDAEYMYSGYLNGEKQSLFLFELPILELAAIGDYVWYDADMDGIQDGGEDEWGFPDVTVNLYNCQDELIGSTTTDADGYYLFDGLIPGDYYVEFIEPEGYEFTLQNQGGDDALDSDADPVTGIAECTNLEGGETDLTWDAGLVDVPQEGCTLTIGYWKTHAGFGPQPDMVSAHLPIWLGTGAGKSINVNTAQIAYDILTQHVYGNPSNGITKLYAQLLGAKLNISNGADDSDVAGIIALADAFLANYDWTDWNSLSKPDKRMVNGWKSDFDDYNNGDIGPGHCGD